MPTSLSREVLLDAHGRSVTSAEDGGERRTAGAAHSHDPAGGGYQAGAASSSPASR
ncbi:MAG: hypothetical protein WB800_44195 [Streptosporangiaceae bacterium]